MRVSYSKVDCWRQCPKKYYFKYIEGLETDFDYSASNPLTLGKTLDVAVEHGMEKAEDYYWSQYNVASDEGVTELMKIRHWLPELNALFNGGDFQVKMFSKHGEDDFIGFADCIVGGTLYDMKYSNNVEGYRDSAQLHIYASELSERPTRMAYVCVPKLFTKKYKEGESKEEYKERQAMLDDWEKNDIQRFRRYVMEELKDMEIQIVWVEYDQSKVDAFWEDVERMKEDTTYEPIPNDNCKYCDFKNLCERPRKKRTVKPREVVEKLLNT